MDNLQSAAQAFAALRFKDRVPSWKEYKTGSPAEQRAIMERWMEIAAPSAVNPFLSDAAYAERLKHLKPQVLDQDRKFAIENHEDWWSDSLQNGGR